VLRTLKKSVLDIDKPHKRWKKESESEITMCDRMQMYNTKKDVYSFMLSIFRP
jgi:hypothetical protein